MPPRASAIDWRGSPSGPRNAFSDFMSMQPGVVKGEATHALGRCLQAELRPHHLRPVRWVQEADDFRAETCVVSDAWSRVDLI